MGDPASTLTLLLTVLGRSHFAQRKLQALADGDLLGPVVSCFSFALLWAISKYLARPTPGPSRR